MSLLERHIGRKYLIESWSKPWSKLGTDDVMKLKLLLLLFVIVVIEIELGLETEFLIQYL